MQCFFSYLSRFMTFVQCMASRGLYPREIPAAMYEESHKRNVKNQGIGCYSHVSHDIYAPAAE